MELEPINWLDHTIKLPRDYQVDCFVHLEPQRNAAMFSDPGMGKTKSAIDIVCYRAMMRQIDTVILFAWPFGVHDQWVDEQIPKHWWKSVGVKSAAWNGVKLPPEIMRKPAKGTVHFIAFNIEATRSGKAMDAVHALADANGKNIMFILDESQRAKDNTTVTWKELKDLAMKCQYRMIMTGTPIAKTLLDEWAQLSLMDYSITGHRYKTTFNAQFSQMGGFNGREVVGSRNVEEFNRIIAPYVFRATKEQLNTPPKLFDELVFNMTNQQRNAQEELRQTLELELRSIELREEENVEDVIVRAPNVGVLYMKLQQVANGFIIDRDNNVNWFKENPRLDILEDFLSIEREQKIVIWARFHPDIEAIMKRFGEMAVAYYGLIDQEQKRENKKRFINDDKVRLFVANQQSAGVGVDGLQEVCQTAVYYSQDFNSILRTQSEDRINRFGSIGESSRYFDIIGRASIDRIIKRNIDRKRSFSDMSLRDLKEAIREIQIQK